MKLTRHRMRAFTLVELLVAIGIIALLVAILLPTVRKAWQAAQNAQCLSNLRQIGQAVQMYRSDTGRIPLFFILRNFPWQPVANDATGNAVWWTTFSHGGKTTHPSITVGYMEDTAKPLNKYLYREMYSEPWTGTKTSAEMRVNRDVFRCPADIEGNGLGNGGVGLPLNYLGTGVPSPYELYGTSYMSNRGWMYDDQIWALFSRVMTPPWTHQKLDFVNNGISKIVSRWNASETYIAADLLFIWSIFYHTDVPGAHSNKQSLHNGVFLDGHAKHLYITKEDLRRWGPRIPGVYVPKYGESWREFRTWDGRRNGYPWSTTDPFGVGPKSQSPVGAG